MVDCLNRLTVMIIILAIIAIHFQIYLGPGSTGIHTAKRIGVTQTQPQKTFRPHAIYTGLCQDPRDGSVYIQPAGKAAVHMPSLYVAL